VTWYDPDEVKGQADGDKAQPEFDPPATPGYDESEDSLTDEEQALIDRANEVANVVSTQITNGPEAVFP